MSSSTESNGRPSTPDGGLGVLSNLPRTRPQRSSARRAAARKADAGATPTEAKPKASSARSKPKGGTKTAIAAAKSSGGPAKGKAQPKAKTKAKTKAKAQADSSSATATAARVPLVRTAKSSRRPEKPHAKPARKAPKRPVGLVDESVPRQGFESEMDRASGPVQPPGGTELVATAAEIVTELARAGVSTGERLLKDLLGRLPLS